MDAEHKKSTDSIFDRLWAKKAPLYKGCRYIVKNFTELARLKLGTAQWQTRQAKGLITIRITQSEKLVHRKFDSV